MKKILISIVFLLSSSALMAQTNFKKNGYYSGNRKFTFDESKTNIPMKGYYVLKDGTEVEAILAYRKPEWVIGPFAAGASLVVCKELTGKPMDVFNPDSEPNFKEYVKKNAIRGFYLDGHLYGNVPNTGWAIVLSEGAIRSFITVVKLKTKSGIQYASFEQTQKLGGKAYGSAFGGVSSDRLLEMISDAPEIAASVKNGTNNIYEAILKYNQWYDANNPDKIEYILGKDGLTKAEEARRLKINAQQKKEKAEKLKAEAEAKEAAKIAEEARLKAEKEAEAYQKVLDEAKSRAHFAPEINNMENRPTVASPEIASAKPEVKVKKQKFVGRIDRIKADGNKVGILVNCSNIKVKKSQTFASREVVPVFGSFTPIEGCNTWAQIVTEKLNNGFSTDVFEVIDIKTIPIKNNNDFKSSDWWATKYKLVLEYSISAYYDAYLESNPDSTIASKQFIAQFSLDVGAYTMAAEEGNKSKLKSAGAGASPKTYSYSFPAFVGDEKSVVHTIQELKELVNPPTDEELMSNLIKDNELRLDKFIKKQIKKSKK